MSWAVFCEHWRAVGIVMLMDSRANDEERILLLIGFVNGLLRRVSLLEEKCASLVIGWSWI